MGLFQNTVINKYLKSVDAAAVKEAYEKLKKYFHNPEIQNNIRELKEEEFQEGFVRELFVEILGYTLNPLPNYNFVLEKKNVNDARKADGAIIGQGVATPCSTDVIAVVELKATDTTDLGKVETQAFGYKNNQSDCVYVITSNFEKLRFYIDNAIEHIEFNLFTISEIEFEVLYLCLSYDSISKGIPRQIKAESVSEEDIITKKLYADYSLFKRELHQNLVKLNPQYDALTLFKKSQKLLDRFLFILFAEDRQLLPPNSIRTILDQWKQMKEWDNYNPLYSRFKLYFGYMNTGRKGDRHDIFAYNGGLFLPDEITDAFIIDDDLLYKHTLKLSDYDFVSEVDVNILGHIFENSLNELDEIKAELEGKEIDKTKTKRKKDGIFYTPKYITKYIVDNTVGKLCEEKKAELRIEEADYITDRKRQKKTIQPLAEKLTKYRDWLLQIKICDPACGSGAFLNQALDFLINEHRYIDELQAKLFGDALVLSDIENSILENNLFGVDINEESVEIARLSLWLRTARPNRKLNDLSKNIKCGNSLIDDPAVAGDKAFNWFLEFPKVFGKPGTEATETIKEEVKPDFLKLIKEHSDKATSLAKMVLEETEKVKEYVDKIEELNEPESEYNKKNIGFDVVIGNPPYGADLRETELIFLEKSYNTFEYQVNSYVLFYEKGLSLLKKQGILGFITPATFTYQHYFKKLRLLMQGFTQLCIAKYLYEVFDDADIGDSVSWIIRKKENTKKDISILICKSEFDINNTSKFIPFSEIVKEDGRYNLNPLQIDFDKIYKKAKKLGDITNIIVGIKPYQVGKGIPKQTRDIVEKKIFTSNIKKDDSYINCVIGKDFHRYCFITQPAMYLKYGVWLAEPRESAPFFDSEKIIIRQTSDSLICHLDDKQKINLNNVYNIGLVSDNIKLKFILSLLNSKLINLIYQAISQEKGRIFAEVKKVNLAMLPIIIGSKEEQEKFVEKVDLMISLNKALQEVSGKFQRTIERKFGISELPKKLENWYLLTYAEFIKELGKKKIKMALAEEAEWEDYFLQESKKAKEIKKVIDDTDKEIDGMVYGLYGLTPEEIRIVEGR